MPEKKTSSTNSYLTAAVIVIGIIGSVVYLAPSWKDKDVPSITKPQSSDSYISVTTTKCSICGREFTGNGYEEVSDGVWKLCSNQYQSQICSSSCGMKHTAKMNRLINSLPTEEGRRDGKIYEANACSMCNGTGIEKNTSHLTDEVGRVCPMCDGKGVRSY